MADPDGPRRRGSRARTATLLGVVGLAVLALVLWVPRPGPEATPSSATLAPTATPATPNATPAPAAFISTGSMLTARVGHAVILLTDGRVLIAGGSGSDGACLASAELYDPVTGTFTTTGSMTTARDYPTATLLTDGRVLIAGGQSALGGGEVLASAELYDPRSGTFSRTGSMATPRQAQTATLLSDGKVLVAGGLTRVGLPDSLGLGDVTDTAELYDPESDTFSRTGPLAEPRGGATATLLLDGRVLIAGGSSNLSIYGNADWSAELYDAKVGVFRATGSMSISRLGATATLLPNGRVLIAGGNAGAVDVINPKASVDVYDPAAGTFSPAGSMAFGRYQHTATLLFDGRVLVAGGEGPGRIGSAELFNPATGTFNPAAPNGPVAEASSATRLPDGRVLFAGGWDGGAIASARLYRP